MVLRKLAVALLSVGVMLPGLGHALAVKDVQTKSALGEPFQGEVELTDLGDLNADEIKVSLATQEDFERLGIERVYFLTDLRFDVVVNQGGRSYIRITTNKPVREPYLDFVVRIAWPGNARLQNVTALLDPPVVSDSSASMVSQPVSTAPAVPPVVTPAAPPVVVAPVEPAPVVVAPPAPVRKAPPAPVVATPAPVEKAQPTPAPARPAPVASSAAGEYRVQAGDTLSSIVSQQVNAGDASRAQAMVAIQRANPAAFVNNNINLLRRGQVLRIPSESEIREISAREAIASVREQTEAWRSTSVATAPASAQQVNAAAKAEKPAAPAPVASKPEMKLLGAQAGQQGGAAAAGADKGKPGEAAKLKENQAKAEAAKTEKDKLAGKVGTLDAEVKANDQQLQVQNAKLAELNAQLKAQKEQPAAPAPVAKAVPEVAAPAAPAAAATPEGVETKAAETAPAIESTPLPEKPKPAPVVVQEEVVDEGLPLPLIGGAAALLALLGGGFWWTRKRRQEKEEEEALAELEAMDDSSPVDELPDALFSGNAGSAPEDDWSIPQDDTPALVQDRVLADPMEEVEQYLAFERYPQAVGFLNKAIAASPERADLRLKLLEIYAHLDDWNGFVEQEAWFENAGDLDALAHAEELKVGLTPPARQPSRDDPLPYEQSTSAAVEEDLPSLEDLEMDFNATVSASSPALQAVQDSDLSLDNDFSLDTAAFDAELAAVPAADSGLSLDEELDFSFDSEPAAETSSGASDDLSFELDTSDFDSTAQDLDVQVSAADEGMDFSLEEDISLEGATAATGDGLGELVDFDEAPDLKEPEVKTTEDDLSFSLDDLEAESAVTTADLEGDFSLDEKVESDFSFDETTQLDSGLNDAAADFDSTLRMDTVPAAAEPVAVPASDVAVSDDLGLDDEFDFLADTDENATKLDLARAYIDMGDMEGARDILHEVLSEGSATQKDEAKSLLAQAG